jgi:hypothetical protein
MGRMKKMVKGERRKGKLEDEEGLNDDCILVLLQ